MSQALFPSLAFDQWQATRDALHDYSRVLGLHTKANRAKRKHWWHASLRPSLNGLTTGVIYAPTSYELELDFVNSRLQVQAFGTPPVSIGLKGQAANDVAQRVDEALSLRGVESTLGENASLNEASHIGYSEQSAKVMHQTLVNISAAMEGFRAQIPEETSPIQLWPHHFDLSMIWLPGEKVPEQDPNDEEYSDKQMNFGFAFGDSGIAEPYFYVTAYPSPRELTQVSLPKPTTWQSGGFNGAVLLYKDLVNQTDPDEYLQTLWSKLISSGRGLMSNE